MELSDLEEVDFDIAVDFENSAGDTVGAEADRPASDLPCSSRAMRIAAPVGMFVGGAASSAAAGAMVAVAGTVANMVVAAQFDPSGHAQVDLGWALQAGIGGAAAALLGALAGTATVAWAAKAGFSDQAVPKQAPKHTGLQRLLAGWRRTSHEGANAIQQGRREFDDAANIWQAIAAGLKAGAKTGYEAARVAGRWAGAIQGALIAGMTGGAMGAPIGVSAAASLAGAVVGAAAAAPVAGAAGGVFGSIWGSLTAFTYRALFGRK